MRRNSVIFYSLLIFLIILIGQLPIILHIFHTPKGYYYPYLDKVSFSDFYYLGLIRFGMGDSWMMKIPYVTVPHEASLIQVFFLWLGKIANLFQTGPAEIFAVFRVIGGVVFLLSSLFLFKTILAKDKVKWVFVFFLLAEPIVDDFEVWIWHFGEAARRVSVMPPHYTIGKGLTILSLVFLILYFKKAKAYFILISSLLIFLAGIIYPPSVFIVVFSLGITAVVHFFVRSTKFTLAISTFLLSALLSLLLLKLELDKGYPWNRWSQVELGWNVPSRYFELEYLKMMGILWVLAVFGVISKLKSFNFWNLFIAIWAFSAFLLFPFANMLHLGKFRFTEGTQIVPLAIISFWGFEEVVKKFGKIFKRAFLFLFISYFIVIASLTIYLSTISLWPYFTNVYFQPEELSALNFMENYVKKNTLVLAGVFPSNYLPAFAQVRTLLGFSDFYQTYDEFLVEKKAVLDILAGELSEDEVESFLQEKKVDYVYYQTYELGEKNLYPNILEKIYANADFKIYRVRKSW